MIKLKVYYKIQIFLLLLNYSLNYYSNETSTKDKIWDPDSLYDYTKSKFLDSKNPNKSTNLKYMIVDPENYLNNTDLSSIKLYMKLLYDKFKINNYIFLISHLELPSYKMNDKEDININIEAERFLSKFNYIMLRDNSFYEDNMTLSIIFFIKDNNMKIRTGHSLRNIIKDKDCINILNKRKKDLKDENYYKVIYDLIDDIYRTYISNYKYYNSFIYLNKGKIMISLLLILISSIFIFGYITYLPESERENKIKEFLERYKCQNITKLIKVCCFLCLENFMPEKDKFKIENIFDKKRLNEEKTIKLECNHKFHEKCINDWLKTNKKCPLCDIKEKHISRNDNENNRLLSGGEHNYLNNYINDIVYIQRNAFPHLINEAQGNRIISDFIEEQKNEFENYIDY